MASESVENFPVPPPYHLILVYHSRRPEERPDDGSPKKVKCRVAGKFPARVRYILEWNAMFPTPSATNAAGGLWWIGVWIVCGLLCGGVCATLAIGKGLHAWRWFFAGFAGLVLGVAAVLAKRPNPKFVAGRTGSPVLCRCGHENHPAARKCLGCGTALRPQASSEVDHV